MISTSDEKKRVCVWRFSSRLSAPNTRPKRALFFLILFTTYRAAGPREASRHADHADPQKSVGQGGDAGEHGSGARSSPGASGSAGAIAAAKRSRSGRRHPWVWCELDELDGRNKNDRGSSPLLRKFGPLPQATQGKPPVEAPIEERSIPVWRLRLPTLPAGAIGGGHGTIQRGNGGVRSSFSSAYELY